MVIDLVGMKNGQLGVVKSIDGGHDMAERVQKMGIRVGKKIKKVESHFGIGPQTILIDNFKVAIGIGVAKKIFVEVEK